MIVKRAVTYLKWSRLSAIVLNGRQLSEVIDIVLLMVMVEQAVRKALAIIFFYINVVILKSYCLA